MASRSFIDYLLNPGPDEAELQEAIRSAAGVADDIAAAFVAIDAAVAATAADVATVAAQATYIDGVVAEFTTDAAAALAAIATDRAAALAAIGAASTTAQNAIDATASSAITTVNDARDDAIAATDAGVATVATAVTDAQAALVATGASITTDLNIIKADTQNFRDEAETARDEAVAAAASVDIPVIAPGDAGKVLTVKVDESGSEWVEAGVDLPAGGTTNQFLRKASAAEQDAEWADLPDASTIQQGVVELATSAETVTGTDPDRVTTPAGVKAAIDAAVGLVSIPTQGRISLTSGVAVTESDVVGATAVYLVPDGLNLMPIYDGAAWRNRPFVQMTLTLAATPHPSGKLFDTFVAWQGGAMIFGSGPDWTVGGGTVLTRGTGAGSTEIEMFEGRWVNKHDIELKNGATTYASVPARQATLVGGFATIAAGQTVDAMHKRWVWNVNGVRRLLRMPDTAATSWTYSVATYRQWNADVNNEFSYFQGLGGRMLEVDASGWVDSSTATKRLVTIAIGIDMTTAPSNVNGGGGGLAYAATGDGTAVYAKYRGYPGDGLHFAAALERGGGADTQTWFGNQANFPVGMSGETII